MEGYKLGRVAKAEKGRYRKANKIIAILGDFVRLENAKVLEVGTGAGYIAHAISKISRSVHSVDIVDDRAVKEGYKHKIVKDELLPFGDKEFDVVISNHVLEHVPNQETHLSEMGRVLKKDGLIYLATPNKWWITDPHYKLPFISWMPRKLASSYLKITKKRKWDIYSVSSKRIAYLARRSELDTKDMVWPIISKPKKYKMKVPRLITKLANLTPVFFRNLVLFFVPTHIKILKHAVKEKQS